MGKTRDLFKKIRDTKETSHAKMGTIKDRNRMDLTEAKNSKNTQNYTKKIFMAQVTNTQNSTKKIFMAQVTKMVCLLT